MGETMPGGEAGSSILRPNRRTAAVHLSNPTGVGSPAGPRPGVKPEPVATRFAGPRGGRGSDPFHRSTPFYVMQYAPVDDTL